MLACSGTPGTWHNLWRRMPSVNYSREEDLISQLQHLIGYANIDETCPVLKLHTNTAVKV